MLKHFKGSRAIAAWFHYAFGLERNTQHDDPEMQKYSTFSCVKDRYTGRANGNTMCPKFDQEHAQHQARDFTAEAGCGAGLMPYELLAFWEYPTNEKPTTHHTPPAIP